jgi:hypothetical protein
MIGQPPIRAAGLASEASFCCLRIRQPVREFLCGEQRRVGSVLHKKGREATLEVQTIA